MEKTVKIELRPYDALAIYCFMNEYINDSNKHLPEMQAIHETLATYKTEVFKKISMSQIEDALLECKVNYLTERQPPRK